MAVRFSRAARAKPGSDPAPQSVLIIRAGEGVENALTARFRQRNDSMKLLIRVLKSPFDFRRSSILRMEWITVEWCLPPKLLPISGSDALVRFLQRYIAICRGIATDFELFRDFSSPSFSW